MSYSTSTSSDFVARNPKKSSRQATSHNFFGGAAVACIVVGCAWVVHANVFGASIYPALSDGNFEVAVTRRPPTVTVRKSPPVANNNQLALLEPARSSSAPATISSGPSFSFDDRFAAAAPQGVAPRPPAETPKPAEAPRLAAASKPKESSPAPLQLAAIVPPPPRVVEPRAVKSPATTVQDMAQRAKAAVMSITGADKPSIFEKLWGKPQSQPSLLSYASADASVTGGLGNPGQSRNPALAGSAPYDRSTAVYDISAHMVYLPDGSKLEAHSGLGSMLDDPRHVNVRMHGATPPHVYELKPREALFHGVPALRLNPVGGEDAIFGRSGLLAHTYMLGPNGDSNGCVSFRDYNAFLNAYRNQGIKRLAVVARVE